MPFQVIAALRFIYTMWNLHNHANRCSVKGIKQNNIKLYELFLTRVKLNELESKISSINNRKYILELLALPTH